MNKKYLPWALFTLSVSGLLMAAEYNAPDVKFKAKNPSYKSTRAQEFESDYKIEDVDKADRGIASEKEREPSSYHPKVEKKKFETYEEDEKSVKDTPKPWLYNTVKGKDNR